MSNPTRHHHVPRTYLKNFSFSRKKDEFEIYTLDKFSGNIFKANINNIAVEKDFYTVNEIDDKYAWEKYYAETIEPEIGVIIPNIIKVSGNCLIKDKVKILNNEQKSRLSRIMVCQLLRGKNCREYELKLFKEKAPHILADARNKFGGKGNKNVDALLENYQFTEDMFKTVAMQSIISLEEAERIAQVLFSHCWIIYGIRGSSEFVTSDNPVMFMDIQTLNVTPFHNGAIDSKTTIFYPISPKLMIALYSYNTFFGLLNDYDGNLFFVSDRDTDFINNINKKQVEQCNRQVFSRTEKILKEIF